MFWVVLPFILLESTDGERRPLLPEPINGDVPQTKVFPALHSLSVVLTPSMSEDVLNHVSRNPQALNVGLIWFTAMMATVLLC